jgi:hypothetical protein
MDILSTSVGVLIGLVTTSLFKLIESGVKKTLIFFYFSLDLIR